MKRDLTERQKFALRAVEKGAVVQKRVRMGWRIITKYVAWDSDITTQIRSLLRVHRLIRFKSAGVLELRVKKHEDA